MKVQRLRVTYARAEPVRHISHLDIMRFWERALRRAGLPLAYSQGLTPYPQISIASPLALGVTSDCELMDVFLRQRVSPDSFIKGLSHQMPAGFEVLAVQEVGLGAPALQTLIRWADYELEAHSPWPREALEERVRRFLEAATVPWQHQREKETRRYDLRALVGELRLVDCREGRARIALRLRTDSSAAGRPEQVAAALGLALPPLRIHRQRLILADSSPAREAWRRQGRYQ